jgi:myo-inositol-1(or 4)-monophosphatase
MPGDDALQTSQTLEGIAREAGEMALEYIESAALDVQAKGHLDLVTEADRAVEQRILERLDAAFPKDGIVGEEGTAKPSLSGRVWVIDPIDGTTNFVRGMDTWSVSVGLFAENRPVFGVVNLPAQQRLLVGGEWISPRLNGHPLPRLSPPDSNLCVVALGLGPATRRFRSAALVQAIEDAGFIFRYSGCGSASLVDLILGRVDGYISLGESSWDMIASLAILAPLGGTSSSGWAADSLREKRSIVCGTRHFVEMASIILREVDEADGSRSPSVNGSMQPGGNC